MTPTESYREIPLTQGKVALISAHRYEYLSQFKWTAFRAKKKWYAIRRAGMEGSRGNLMHREILGILNEKVWCDHINGDGLDNRDENIRRCSVSQNQINRWADPENRGVRQQGDRWRVRIKIQGNEYHIGIFDTKHDAQIAYAVAAKIMHGNFRHLSVLRPEDNEAVRYPASSP